MEDKHTYVSWMVSQSNPRGGLNSDPKSSTILDRKDVLSFYSLLGFWWDMVSSSIKGPSLSLLLLLLSLSSSLFLFCIVTGAG